MRLSNVHRTANSHIRAVSARLALQEAAPVAPRRAYDPRRGGSRTNTRHPRFHRARPKKGTVLRCSRVAVHRGRACRIPLCDVVGRPVFRCVDRGVRRGDHRRFGGRRRALELSVRPRCAGSSADSSHVAAALSGRGRRGLPDLSCHRPAGEGRHQHVDAPGPRRPPLAGATTPSTGADVLDRERRVAGSARCLFGAPCCLVHRRRAPGFPKFRRSLDLHRGVARARADPDWLRSGRLRSPDRSEPFSSATATITRSCLGSWRASARGGVGAEPSSCG